MLFQEIINIETNNYKYNGCCDANSMVSVSAAVTAASVTMLTTAQALC